MDNKDLFVQQVELQKEGNEVLEKLQLIPLLSKYGKPIIVGSLATGLMTWRDIDIEVITEVNSSQDLFDMVSHLFVIDNARNIILQNNADYRIRKNNPDGLYLGFKYQDKEVWKFDIWFLSVKQHSGKDDIEWFNKNINEDNRKIILMIKDQIAIHPEYRKTIFSQDIYDAVLKEKVNTYDEFVNYLKKIGKNI